MNYVRSSYAEADILEVRLTQMQQMPDTFLFTLENEKWLFFLMCNQNVFSLTEPLHLVHISYFPWCDFRESDVRCFLHCWASAAAWFCPGLKSITQHVARDTSPKTIRPTGVLAEDVHILSIQPWRFIFCNSSLHNCIAIQKWIALSKCEKLLLLCFFISELNLLDTELSGLQVLSEKIGQSCKSCGGVCSPVQRHLTRITAPSLIPKCNHRERPSNQD